MNELGKDLCTAAFMGSLSFLEDVLSVSDASTANLTDHMGDTPLHRAVVAGQLECAHILLENQADVNARGQNGATPLHRAAEAINCIQPDAKSGLTMSAVQDKIIEVTTLLIARHGNLSAKDDNGMMPEDIAHKLQFTELAQIMSDLRVDQEALEKELEHRKQIKALENACLEGAVSKVAQILKEHPSIVDETLPSTDPAIVAAARSGSVELVHFLLEQGATSLVNTTTKETALHVAVGTGNKELFVSLLHHCPQLLASDINEEETPLHIAAEMGHSQIVEIFLQLVEQGREACSADSPDASDVEKASAQLDPYRASKRGGASPLHRAAEKRHFEVVELYCGFVRSMLKKFPEDPSPLEGLQKLDKRGFNPFHIAAAHGDVAIMKALLDVGVDINARVLPDIDRSLNPNQTALSMAGSRGDSKVVRFLLRSGAKDPENKAVRRTLRASHTEAAGLMLCYNEYASIMPASRDPHVPAYDGKKPDYAVSLMWNNRDLKALHEEWLRTATVERCPEDSLTAITQIDLSSNQLQELPLGLFQLPYLTKVDVSKNNLEFLPTSGHLGWKCVHLLELKMKHNRMKSIPEGIFKLPRLKELEASHNSIESVPMAMWMAPKLTVLRLSHNRIVKLQFPHPLDEDGLNTSFSSSANTGSFASPARLTGFPSLESLDVLSMPLPRRQSNSQKSFLDFAQTLPAEPQTTYTHKRAEMVANRENYNRRYRFLDSVNEGEGEELAAVAETPQSLEGTPSCLETLDLAHNQLTFVPQGLCCLAPKLHKLILAHNQISDLGHINDFPPEIDTLDAQNNRLRTAIKPVLGSNEASYMNIASVPIGYCPRAYLQSDEDCPFPAPAQPFLCRHRIHRALKKLSSYRLSNNQLQAVQLFIEMQRRPVGSFSKGTPPDAASGSDESSGTGSGLIYTPTDDKPHTKSVVLGKRNSNSSGHSSGGDEDMGSQELSDMIPISMFPELTTLEVASNKLKSVPKHIHLATLLGSLDISHNTDITTLPLLMGHLEALYYFEYKQVPLKNPSVADLDKFKTASDKIFFMKTLLQEAVANDCMKLMLVGLQKQGKTTILAHLTEVTDECSVPTTFMGRTAIEGGTTSRKGKPGVVGSPLSTVGVDLGIWKYNIDREPSHRSPRGAAKNKSVTFYTWDFGGQEEYYSTHQVFLSSRSLYLIIWNMTRGEEGIEQLAPWLHNIESRAPGSPVIIIGTHLDRIKNPVEKEEQKLKYEKLIRRTYQEKYRVGEFRKMDPGLPDIKGVKFVGLPERKDGKPEGLTELRQFIYETVWDLKASGRHVATKHHRLLEQPIPRSFLKLQFRVREIAAKLKSERKPPVMWETVFREAVKDVIESKRELDQAVTYLHEIGVVLHYDTPALSHLYFVDPQWLCDMLAHVITVPEVNRWINRDSGLNSGILNKSALQQVFRGQIFPIQFQQEYIELLNKFEVAIQIDKSSLLVPSCLSAKPEYTLHHRVNYFPRLTLDQIAEFIPELFTSSEDHKASVSDTDHRLFPQYTGLILRRFYFMPHVPSGFWPRLISRFLADTAFHTVVLECLGYTKCEVQEALRSRSGTDSRLSWVYWRTGLELWFQNSRSILRVSEVMGKKGAFRACRPSPSPFDVPSQPVDPVKDASDLLFDLHGIWTPTDTNQSPRGIEIIVSDCISRQTLQESIAEEKKQHVESSLPPSTQQPPVCAATERRWMGAELLAYTADVLDLLLEDWFPGIGSRDTVKNRFDIPYVNRIVPCPYCVSQASTLDPLEEQSQSSIAGPEVVEDQEESERPAKSSRKKKKKKSKYRLNRPLFTPSPSRSPVKERDGGEFFTAGPQDYDMMVIQDCEAEDPLLPAAAEEEEVEDPVQVGTFCPINQFGFMVDHLILLSRKTDVVECPIHKDTPLPIRDLAPDIMFADFQKYHIEKPCLILSNFVGGGAFGDIYQGTALPHKGASEFDGTSVAVKISSEESPRKLEAKAANRGSFRENPDEITLKTHTEVRAEACLLKELDHPNLVRLVGLSLKPLAIVLEWAPKKGMRRVLADYQKANARLSPATLQETARQVSAGLEFLHSRGTAHFDLKSDNVLVFHFPTPQFALESTTPGAIKLTRQQTFSPHKTAQQLKEDDPTAVLVKITDFGISRQSSLGQYRHRGGTPGFMAPEILRYSGKEAVQSKVDVFSFAMVMYEMVSLQCPFEAEGLHPQQMDKLTVEGKRPILTSRELNNPALFLELMQWCWMADYNKRPSAAQLQEILSSTTIPHLVDSVSLGALESITCACACPYFIPNQDSKTSDWETTQTIQASTTTLTSLQTSDQQHQQFMEASGAKNVLALPPVSHMHVAVGDMFQEVWVASYDPNKFPSAQLHIVGFQGKTKHYVQSLHAPRAPVAAMCAVNGRRDPDTNVQMDTMWVGTQHGELYVFHTSSRKLLLDRQLAIRRDTQGIISVLHMPLLEDRSVVVVRKDGCLLLFDDEITQHKFSDDPRFDNCRLDTPLPVKCVVKTRNERPVYSALVRASSSIKSEIWCGCDKGEVQLFMFSYGKLEYSTNVSYGSFPNPGKFTRSEECYMAQLVLGKNISSQRDQVWSLVQPEGVIMCWDAQSKQAVKQVRCSNFTSYQVSSMQLVNSKIYLATRVGKVVSVDISETPPTCKELHGHCGDIYSVLPLGSRVLPRQWLPSIIGRINVKDKFANDLSEEAIKLIQESMIGRPVDIVLTVGKGFHGLGKSNPLASSSDSNDSFLLLWM